MRPVKKVLICDDELYILEAVQYIVRQAGFEPLLAQNGEEAIALIQKENPDLVILDIMMPKIGGFEVCRRLKNDESTKDIYVMILTARGDENDSLIGKQAGADEFITKPFSPSGLSQRLSNILKENSVSRKDKANVS